MYNIGPNQHNLHCTSSFIQYKIVQDFGGATFRVAKFKNETPYGTFYLCEVALQLLH